MNCIWRVPIVTRTQISAYKTTKSPVHEISIVNVFLRRCTAFRMHSLKVVFTRILGNSS